MESHYQEAALFQLSIDAVTQNLVENLHMRWGYGLLYVDRYVGENNQPINIVYGLRIEGEDATYGMRIVLEADRHETVAEVNLWRVYRSGWPFQNVKRNIADNQYYQRIFERIGDDIIKFCEQPHGQATGVMDALRSLFGRGGEKRKYKR